MKEVYYIVKYKIYHYNSGAADNGTQTHEYKCKTLNEAKSVRDKINRVYELGLEYGGDDPDYIWVSDELIFNNTAVGGFINGYGEIIEYNVKQTKIF